MSVSLRLPGVHQVLRDSDLGVPLCPVLAGATRCGRRLRTGPRWAKQTRPPGFTGSLVFYDLEADVLRAATVAALGTVGRPG